MVKINNHVAKHVNVLSVGVVEGAGLTQLLRLQNHSILQQYADLGWSLWFPPGKYEIEGTVVYTSKDHVTVWGEGSEVFQLLDDARTFEFQSVDHLDVHGMHIYTPYFGRRTVTPGVTGDIQESGIYARDCRWVSLHRNVVEGYNCYALCVAGGDQISICGNKFKDGHFTLGDPVNENTADIRVNPGSGGNNDQARDILVEGNHCNTRSLLGISAQRATRRFIVKNNYVICRDESGNDIKDYVNNQRKAGIELQYYMDISSGTSGNDNLDSELHEMVVEGNQVEGCRFAGIEFQSSPINENNPGGFRGTIANNKIRYCATEQSFGSDGLQGGIVTQQHRDLVISGNVIKNIPDDVANTFGTGAIVLRNTSQRATTPDGTFGSTEITGNIITDVAGRGISLQQCGDVLITGNTFRDVRKRNIWSTDPGTARGSKMKISGNRFVSEVPIEETEVVRVEASTSNYSIVDNYFEFTDAVASEAFLVRCFNTQFTFSGNRLIGPGDTSSLVGLYIANSQATRYEEMILSDNSFADLGIGVQGNAATTRGPALMNNCNFARCGENVRAADANQVYMGQWGNKSLTGNQTHAVAHHHQAPTQGNWIEGDTVFNSSVSVGEPLGWICTVAGSPGTWVPMPLFGLDNLTWGGVYEEGATPPYTKNQVVRDSIYSARANADTSDRAELTPAGNPEWAFVDSPAWTTAQNIGWVKTGNIYTFNAPGAVNSARVWIPSDASPDHVYILEARDVTDPANPFFVFQRLLTLVTPGAWYVTQVEPSLIFTGESIEVSLIAENRASLLEVVNSVWEYDGEGTGDPGSNKFNRNAENTQVRIAALDYNSVDQTTVLTAVQADDTIVMTGPGNSSREYAVVTNQGQTGDSFIYSTVLTYSQGSWTGGEPYTIRIVRASNPTDYVRIPAYWPANNPSWASSVQGFIQTSEAGSPTFNNEGYGIDIQFEDWVGSPDFDLISISSRILS